MSCNTPEYWKTDLDYVERMWNGAQKCTEKKILCQSAGDRPVYMLAYGKKKSRGCANYSSALGGRDKNCFAPQGQNACVILIGAVHGQETEGVAALTDLISLIETGKDLSGNTNEELLDLIKNIRLVIVPVANVDGRARVEPDSMIGKTLAELRYWGQGTWSDGSLCGWPECKRVHPIKERAGFLGGYYNDDGINLMHDNFFHPMARETAAILDLCESEAADYVIQLHGGGNIKGGMLPTEYVTAECSQAIEALYQRCQASGNNEGLDFFHGTVPTIPSGDNPPSFNLVSAIHHVCGAVSACYESNEGIVDEVGTPLDHKTILRMHEILFKECFALAQGK